MMFLKEQLAWHCFRMYVKILNSCLSTFGFGQLFLYYLIKVPFRLIFVHATMALDNIFFPQFRRTGIERPLFIIGHPRSATSFMHSLLGEKSEFVTFSNWEVRNPALIMKWFLMRFPLMRVFLSIILLDFRSTPWRLGLEARRHRNRMLARFQQQEKDSDTIAPEEELLFINTLDTQVAAVETPVGFNDPRTGFPDLCFHDEHPHEKQSMAFFRGCLKRQIYYQGRKQVVAKMNFSLFRIKSILKMFPDARFVFVLRSPLETMPSHLSAQREALDLTFGLENIEKEFLTNFFENRYRYNVLFYQRLVELLEIGEIPTEQVLVITYEEIRQDLLGVVEKIREFGELQFKHELKKKINNLAARQGAYQRSHTNLPLEAFGLTEEKVRSDCSSFFDLVGGSGQVESEAAGRSAKSSK